MSNLPPSLNALRTACAVMDSTEVVAIAPRGWSLEDVAEIAGVSPDRITAALNKIHGHIPVPERIDAVCQFLGDHNLTPPGGWSVAAMAALTGCDRGTMHKRIKLILTVMRARLEDRAPINI